MSAILASIVTTLVCQALWCLTRVARIDRHIEDLDRPQPGQSGYQPRNPRALSVPPTPPPPAMRLPPPPPKR